jgi:hypothetical protein
MATVSELQARVASTYEGLHLPAWPDPHSGMTSPRDEEYSRVTDPERYRIVHARAATWAAALHEALDVPIETLAQSDAADAGPHAFDRGVRLVPRQPDALPLLLLERDVPTQPVERRSPSWTSPWAAQTLSWRENRTAAVTPAIRAPVTCSKQSTPRSDTSLAGRMWCCAERHGKPSGTQRAGALAVTDMGRTSAR